MKRLQSIVLALCGVILFHMYGTGGGAELGPSVTAQGKISSLKDQELKIATANGDVLVKLSSSTKLTAESPITLSEIKTGLYVGAAAQKQPDGTFLASAINVFAENERGLLEGHRPMSSLPNSTMTNANIERVEDVVVRDIKGPMLTLKYKDGEVKVFVPANTPIMKRVPGEKGMLKLGATVRVQGSQAADGTISATQITIRGAIN